MAVSAIMGITLNSADLFEGGEGTVLLDGLETFHRDIDDDGLLKLGDIDTALLKIRLAAYLAGRIELRRTGTVRVPPADLRALPGDFAGSCHSRRMVPLRY